MSQDLQERLERATGHHLFHTGAAKPARDLADDIPGLILRQATTLRVATGCTSGIRTPTSSDIAAMCRGVDRWVPPVAVNAERGPQLVALPRRKWPWVAAAIVACGQPADRPEPASAAPLRDVPHVMPVFDPQVWPGDDVVRSLGDPAGIAVTASGIIAMLDPDGPDDPVLLLIDAQTGVSKRTIRRGRGPRELSGAGQVFAVADQFVILDLARMTLLEVDTTGTVLSEQAAPVTDALIVVAGGDSLDVIPIDRPGARGVFRRAINGTGERQLVSPDEPFFASMREIPARRAMPAFAARDGWFVVGDGLRYRLALYSADGNAAVTFGRELPARLPTTREIELRTVTLGGGRGPGATATDQSSELARFADTPLPHFEHPAVWIDSVGRVRVVGTSGDSTFIDVFADSTHLWRVVVGCSGIRRRIAQADQWLALLCSDPEDGGNVLKVWRVSESP